MESKRERERERERKIGRVCECIRGWREISSSRSFAGFCSDIWTQLLLLTHLLKFENSHLVSHQIISFLFASGLLSTISVALYLGQWRCPWCNGYRCRKSTRWLEFKSWTRLVAFQIVLIPLGKIWIQLFSLQLWVNSRAN